MALVVLSMPKPMSMVDRALPAMFDIWLFRNELSALVALNPSPLPLGDRYMPVVSIATAARPRSSTDMDASSFCTVRSSGACKVNSSPRSERVCVIFRPTSKLTVRVMLLLETEAFLRSLALMFSLGFSMSPENST